MGYGAHPCSVQFVQHVCDVAGSEERISNGSVAALTAGELPDKSSRSPDKQLPFQDSSPDISKVLVLPLT